jgi:hypothetical protein
MPEPIPLKAEKPSEFKPSDVQICLRCAKRPAISDEIYCYQCLLDREEFDRISSPGEVPPKRDLNEVLEEDKDIDDD